MGDAEQAWRANRWLDYKHILRTSGLFWTARMISQCFAFAVFTGLVLMIPSMMYFDSKSTTPPILAPRVPPGHFKRSRHGFTTQAELPFNDLYQNVADYQRADLVIAILSAPLMKARRHAVRQTWLKSCHQTIGNKKVVCKFFTDSFGRGVTPEIMKDIEEEQRLHNDLVITPITGAKLGLRFLHMFQWARANYDFQYFLRIDDDVMLCLDRFLSDMELFPKRYFYWGYLHCGNQNLVYIDEGITAFSKDVIRKFLSQDPEFLLCHEFGDQTLALWVQSLGLDINKLYHPEGRFHFHPPASKLPQFCNKTDICQKYIAVHGLYNEDMKQCWENRGHEPRESTYKRIYTSDICKFGTVMDWTRHEGPYKKEPRLCLDPSWNKMESPYKGRQGK